MIIAIDGYEANTVSRVGIGRYAFEILSHLYAIEKNKIKRHEYRIYLPSRPQKDLPEETSWWKYRIVPFSKFWTFIGLPLALYFDSPRAHVIFSPTHYAPRFTSIPKVISIMDLSYLKFPNLFRPKDLYQLIHWTQYSAKIARKILTISEFSRHDILEAYRVDPENVTVTYPGFSLEGRKNMTKKDLSLPKKFILSVGTLQPRKNFTKLIHAFSLLKSSYPSEYKGISLVIVGKKGWLYDEILQSPTVYGVEDSVRFLDFISDHDLPDLYKAAECFVLPSLYEGFGLPVLEAMSYACPVVVSRVSSLPEIAGEAGVYVNPEDEKSIADGIHKTFTEKKTKEGRKRVEIGLAQVKNFSWESAAQKTLEVIESACRKGVVHE